MILTLKNQVVQKKAEKAFQKITYCLNPANYGTILMAHENQVDILLETVFERG